MVLYTKRNYYIDNLKNTNKVLCKESALEFLGLSNGNMDMNIYFYENTDGKEYSLVNDIYCTSISQTFNDMLEDDTCDEQILLESMSNYYYENKESFKGIKLFNNKNVERFNSLKQDAIDYYNDGC